jgi:hypothetical protein
MTVGVVKAGIPPLTLEWIDSWNIAVGEDVGVKVGE